MIHHVTVAFLIVISGTYLANVSADINGGWRTVYALMFAISAALAILNFAG